MKREQLLSTEKQFVGMVLASSWVWTAASTSKWDVLPCRCVGRSATVTDHAVNYNSMQSFTAVCNRLHKQQPLCTHVERLRARRKVKWAYVLISQSQELKFHVGFSALPVAQQWRTIWKGRLWSISMWLQRQEASNTISSQKRITTVYVR